MSDSEDFEEQIRLEAEERGKRDAAADLANAGRTRVDPDGTVYEWDLEKHAWFPKIDQDFIAQYLMNYGAHASDASSSQAPDPSDPSYAAWYYKSCYGVDPDVNDPAYRAWYSSYYGAAEATAAADGAPSSAAAGSEAAAASSGGEDPPPASDAATEAGANEKATPADANAEPVDKSKGKSGKGLPTKRKEPVWFEQTDEHNTNVYVSGLPTDISPTEFDELMSKCGLIAYDYDKRKPKLKLYKNADGSLKGDGLCSYIKKESLPLALQILDGYELRGCVISVEPAHFQMKGDFDPSLRKKPKSNKLKRKLKEKQDKLLDWHFDALPGQRKKSDKVVILKNMFEPHEFDRNPVAIQEIREDTRTECSKSGQVKKVTVFDRNPEGVILVVFKEAEEADACIAALNGRWFGGRKASAETWDGKAKYEVEETEQEREERIRKWESYLEKGGDAASGTSTPIPIPSATVSNAAATTAADGSLAPAGEVTRPSLTAPEAEPMPPAVSVVPAGSRLPRKTTIADAGSTDEELDADSDDDDDD